MSKIAPTVLERRDTFSQPDAEACWALLERITASRHIRRSARLRDFLNYVGLQTIRHGAGSIHEQEIGVTVFGRSEEYDTAVDNIVRVNATELRKRLELYFSEEGAAEEITLEIPRGGYAPVFRWRSFSEPEVERAQGDEPVATVVAPQVPISVGPEADERRNARGDRRMMFAVAVMLIAVAGCASLLWQNHQLQMRLQPWTSEEPLRTFWGEFLGSGNETDLVLADTSFALAKDLSGRTISLKDYLNLNYKHPQYWAGMAQDRMDDLGMVFDRQDGSFGDFRVARDIIALDPFSKTLRLRSARELTAESIRHNNVILIGSSESNPWVDLYKDRLNFSLDYDVKNHHAYVINRHPVAGESAIYEFGPDPNRTGGYGVIAFVPDLSGKGSALILGGTDSHATRAAGEFVTDNQTMALLRQKLPQDGSRYFEVVLETTQLVGTPMHSEIVAYRSYGRLTSHATSNR